jgi:probable phosphoglycerate mutase
MQTQLPLTTLAIFNEIDYGPDENQPEDRVIDRVGEAALKAWEAHAVVPAGWNVNPEAIIKSWQQFAEMLKHQHHSKTILAVTSNGIARFSPHLTGDFPGFSQQHKIKIATGAICIFENDESSETWKCLGWNIKP